jgi:hypothetical protein
MNSLRNTEFFVPKPCGFQLHYEAPSPAEPQEKFKLSLRTESLPLFAKMNICNP